MKQTVLVFVLIVAGATAEKATAPLTATTARSLAFGSIEANDLATLGYCCGGPTCLPGDPCGSGGPRLKIS
jgi:hypothetical protein